MNTAVRPIVWLSVVLAAVAVGWYVKQAPTDTGTSKPTTSGSYLFIAGGSDSYWDLCIAGAKAAAEESGATLVILKPDGEGEEGLKEQLTWLTSIEVDKFDGLAIGPIDPARQTILINSVADKLPVITVDSDAPESRRMFYIGSSNIEAGMIAANMAKAALPEGGKVAVLMASEAKTNAAERKQGLEDALSQDSSSSDEQSDGESPTLEIVKFYLDHGDFDVCRQNVIDACSEHEDLAGIICTFGYHAPIVLEALQDVERGAEIKIIAFDEDERTLAAVENGRVNATIVQDPFLFGVEAIQILEKVRSGKFLSLPIASGAVGVHCKAITRFNVGEYREQFSKRLQATKSAE